jgi:hypothetical protein
MCHLVGTIRTLEKSACGSRMSDHGFWLTQHAKVMPPLDAEVQAFWLGDPPLPINSASAPHGWSASPSLLRERKTKALSLTSPGWDVCILLPCNFEKQLDKIRISRCPAEADNSRFLYAFSPPLARMGYGILLGERLKPNISCFREAVASAILEPDQSTGCHRAAKHQTLPPHSFQRRRLGCAAGKMPAAPLPRSARRRENYCDRMRQSCGGHGQGGGAALRA